MDSPTSGGGFIPPMSPPASVAPERPRVLPLARQMPLRSSGSKAQNLFDYVETHMDKIDVKVKSGRTYGGYSKFGQVAGDLDHLVDMLWVSATPSIQVPFLFTIASRITDYMTLFDFAPKHMFPLLNKLDLIFATFLTGVDAESGAFLLAVKQRPLSITEKVRLQTIVETSRVNVVNVLSKATASMSETPNDTEDESTATETEAQIETEDESGHNMGNFFQEEDDDWEMDMARVYERTVGLLADSDQRPVSTYDAMETD